MSGDVVMLAGPFRSTAIIYNFLKSRFPISRVILEPLPSRLEMLRNRARKLGAVKVLGQFCFRSLIVPYLRAVSGPHLREIDRQYQLDAAPIPESEITRVVSVNSMQSVGLLRKLEPRFLPLSSRKAFQDSGRIPHSPNTCAIAGGRESNDFP